MHEVKCKESVVERLVKLGFSEYEAKAYVAMLRESPVTGYKLARLSGVPPSIIYEVVGKLVARGAAMTLRKEDTTKYAPVPAVEFLDQLQRAHEELVTLLKEDLAAPVLAPDLGYVWNIEGHENILTKAEEMINQANSHIYLAPLPATFPALLPALEKAIRRGVRVVIHSPSDLGLPDDHAAVAPMSGTALRRVEGLSLILVVDGEQVLMGERLGGVRARAFRTRNSLLIFLAQSYLRTDLYLPKVLALPEDETRDLIWYWLSGTALEGGEGR